MELLENWPIYQFADDLALIAFSIKSLKKAILTIENWCNRHEASLNKSKCGIFRISGTTKLTKKESENVLGISFTQQYTYLGIRFNKNL